MRTPTIVYSDLSLGKPQKCLTSKEFVSVWKKKLTTKERKALDVLLEAVKGLSFYEIESVINTFEAIKKEQLFFRG